MTIATGLSVKTGGVTLYLDDPKDRQRYVKYMNPKQRKEFAQFYTRRVLQAKEKLQWFRRMTLKK